MLTFFKENKRKIGSLSWIITLAVLLAVFVFLNVRVLNKNRASSQRLQNLSAKIDNLEEEREKLEEEIEEAKQREFLERKAREDFDRKKEGESVTAFEFEGEFPDEKGSVEEKRK